MGGGANALAGRPKPPVAPYAPPQNPQELTALISLRAVAVVACATWAPTGKPAKGEPGSHLATNKDMAKAANGPDRTIKDTKQRTLPA